MRSTLTPVITFATTPLPSGPSSGVVATLSSLKATSSASPAWSVERFVASYSCRECGWPS